MTKKHYKKIKQHEVEMNNYSVDEENKYQKSQDKTWQPSFWQNRATTACHTRGLELLTDFSALAEQSINLLPKSNWVTGIYKGLTKVVLPLWKLGTEVTDPNCNEQCDKDPKKRVAILLDTLDTAASIISFAFWCVSIAPTEDVSAETAVEVEKYLLLAAFTLNLAKSRLQNYQSTQLEKAKQDERLVDIENRLTALEQDNIKILRL